DAGETINYVFIVTNTGTVTIKDVTINDPMVKAVLNPQSYPSLAPGASVQFTASYIAKQGDIDGGSVHNAATATGKTPDGPDVESPPSEVTLPPNHVPGLRIIKTGTVNDKAGGK